MATSYLTPPLKRSCRLCCQGDRQTDKPPLSRRARVESVLSCRSQTVTQRAAISLARSAWSSDSCKCETIVCKRFVRIVRESRVRGGGNRSRRCASWSVLAGYQTVVAAGVGLHAFETHHGNKHDGRWSLGEPCCAEMLLRRDVDVRHAGLLACHWHVCNHIDRRNVSSNDNHAVWCASE
jgi:hypothetical protein